MYKRQGYTSRNIPSPQIYEDILDRRMKAKAAGDKHTANALKLVCNTTYGCLLNQYNDLYDPLMGRSVCISGQLYLLELAEHCYQEIEGLRIVQLNTDGIMVECDKKDYDTLTAICAEWQSRTGFDLEEDTVVKIAQKDVNNYSQKSNAENMMVKLKAAGYDAFITTKSGTAAGIAKKSAAEIAKEIYNGTCSDARWSSWGNGADRVNRLKQAGYDPSEVQSEVNKLF